MPGNIRGVALSWPAIQKWTPSYLLKDATAGETTTTVTAAASDDSPKGGNGVSVTFCATTGVAPMAARFNFASYQRYCRYVSSSASTEEALL